MEARLSQAALVVAAFAAFGFSLGLSSASGANSLPPSVRTQHFIVTAPTQDLAVQVAQHAEKFRRDLAIEWLGHELPPWRDMCPIDVRLAKGAGGATSFMFDRGVPFGWTMNIQGPPDRILDSVLPHEITHTIFATHFGRPLPRWADEGACTTVEHDSERKRQDGFLIEFLHTDRGIPFNKMFAMKEYPRDILPLYSQGYSLTKYLIQHGGKRKFVDYVGEGMKTNNWTAATRKYYGYENLSDLQVKWVAWVGSGSPRLVPDDAAAGDMRGLAASPPAAPPAQPNPQTLIQHDAIAAATPAAGGETLVAATDSGRSKPSVAMQMLTAEQNAAYGWQAPPAQNSRIFATAEAKTQPPAPSTFSAASAMQPQSPGASVASRPISDGWYARQRDRAQSGAGAAVDDNPRSLPPSSLPTGSLPTGSPSFAAPQPGAAFPGAAQSPPTQLEPSSPVSRASHIEPIGVQRGSPASAGAAAGTAAAGDRRVLMEWSRSGPSQLPTSSSRDDLRGLAVQDPLPLR
jgi:hypothetical protein